MPGQLEEPVPFGPPTEAKKEVTTKEDQVNQRSESKPRPALVRGESVSGFEKEQISSRSLKTQSKFDKAVSLAGLSRLWERLNRSLAETEKTRGYRLVKSARCQMAVCSVIMLQGMMIGYGAANAFDVQAYGGEPAVWADYFEIAFCAFFVLELGARLALERLAFLFGSEWKWNVFDAFLVVMSVSDLVMNGSQSGQFGGASVGRILRLSRFFALMRLSRVMRQLPSLRIILLSILDSMTSLVWCFMFIAFIMYVFAVLIVYGAADYLRSDAGDGVEASIKLWWGGIYRAMVTLFMTISGGVDWADVVVPLRHISSVYEPLFLGYIFLMSFGVLNVVVGAFVATTQQIAANDPEAAAKYAVGQMENYMHKIRGFFKQADVDDTGSLSWEEFRNQLRIPKVQAYFQALDLDVSQAHVLFDLLDRDNSGEVTVDEFVDGCVRLRGEAKSIDVNKVMAMCERSFCRLNEFIEICFEHPDILSQERGKSPTEKASGTTIA